MLSVAFVALCVTSCTRAGFDPRSKGDGAVSSDRAVAPRDGTTGDAPPNDSTDPTLDARPDLVADAPEGWQRLFVVRTISTSPNLFDPKVTKSGTPLRWELGDGTVVEDNGFSHSYGTPGEKLVQVLTSDGALGITEVQLDSERLTGEIPAELGQLANLEMLLLDTNQLTGNIPSELGALSKLKFLDLFANQLSGPIPPQLAQLVNLEGLDLSSNQLNGAIPAALGQMTQLPFLYLDSNQLTGSIPAELAQLTNLFALGLSKNSLRGAIPAALGSLARVQHFDLSFNQLSGAIPSGLAGLTSARTIDLEGNQLSGYQPGAFLGVTAVEDINLRGNLLDVAAVDAIIDDVYQARSAFDFSGIKTLSLGGTNAAPSASARAQVDELRANWGWSISCNGC